MNQHYYARISVMMLLFGQRLKKNKHPFSHSTIWPNNHTHTLSQHPPALHFLQKANAWINGYALKSMRNFRSLWLPLNLKWFLGLAERVSPRVSLIDWILYMSHHKFITSVWLTGCYVSQLLRGFIDWLQFLNRVFLSISGQARRWVITVQFF